MKKSNFAAMLLGTVGGVLFALGMCMALIPEWKALYPGIIFGCIGLIMLLVAVIVWRKMEHKPPLHLSRKLLMALFVGIAGALALGVGMCFCMVWNRMVVGIAIGLIGIFALLCLIPLVKGFKE